MSRPQSVNHGYPATIVSPLPRLTRYASAARWSREGNAARRARSVRSSARKTGTGEPDWSRSAPSSPSAPSSHTASRPARSQPSRPGERQSSR